jgi:prevent-host-death family protein
VTGVAHMQRSGHNEVTMTKRKRDSTRTIAAARFKAECLALLDRVAATGEELVVTKRGRPVARVVAIHDDGALRTLVGSVQERGDVLAPIGDAWDAS